jgi:hypothetical protein
MSVLFRSHSVICLLLVCGSWEVAYSQQDAKRAAIERGLELVQEAARRYPEHRDCFSCHHQTLPMLAMVTARDRGFASDNALLAEQTEFTHEFYTSRINSVREGKGVGGRGMTAGYALWALDLADHPRDETTDALVQYLIKTQSEEGRWKKQTNRPPLEETDITATFLASYYMDRYAGGNDVTDTVNRAKTWIADTTPSSQEGRNMQLLAASRFGNSPAVVDALRARVLRDQHEDGGWSQLEGMASDAYATGQALFILAETLVESSEDHPVEGAIERGVTFLMESRKPDGSWHVVTRSKPIQRYFDNGDPHGKDQFISTPATAWAVAALASTLPNDPRQTKPSFNRDVRLILSDRCFQCHGPDKRQRKASLRLDVREEAIKERDGVAAIVPGKPSASALIARIHSHDPEEQMPPAESGKSLTDVEKRLLKRWIEGGAEYEEHWAFIPPRRPDLPKTSDPEWVRNPIDAFILHRLEQEGLQPAVEATKETLIRRLTLDLTGLAPTLEEIDEFLTDSFPNAYEALVDRLLRSSRYGEHMASSWLDSARYSDTNGYNNDTPRYNWRYRDWVIDAFAQNLPYDQFLTEQLAGDLIPEASLDQRIATGFNRNHNVTSEGGIIDEEYRLEYVADRVDTTATVFMAMTLSCARCHDHKFDPISQREYYEFFAFFNQLPETGYHKEHVGNPNPVVPAPTEAQQARLASLDEAIARSSKVEDRKELEKTKEAFQKQLPTAMVMQEMEKPRETFLLMRGAYDKPGGKVSPNVPQALIPMPSKAARNRLGLAKWLTEPDHPLTARVAVNRIWHQIFGRGIVETLEDFGSQGAWPTHPELLDWLATEFVRTGWDQKRFLKTMVLSSTYRQRSSVRPELLAADPLNTLLARGPRYRLSAEVIRDTALATSGLLSGQIGGPSVKPYQPPGLWIEVIVADDSYSGGKYVQDRGENLYRRSVYTWWKRTCPPPALNAFDAPDREFCTVQRSRTNTPLQALVLLNDPTFIEASRALAERLVPSSSNDDVRLHQAFRKITSRVPESKELGILRNSLHTERERFQSDSAAAKKLIAVGDSEASAKIDPSELAAWTFVCSLIFNLDETITQH